MIDHDLKHATSTASKATPPRPGLISGGAAQRSRTNRTSRPVSQPGELSLATGARGAQLFSDDVFQTTYFNASMISRARASQAVRILLLNVSGSTTELPGAIE